MTSRKYPVSPTEIIKILLIFLWKQIKQIIFEKYIRLPILEKHITKKKKKQHNKRKLFHILHRLNIYKDKRFL